MRATVGFTESTPSSSSSTANSPPHHHQSVASHSAWQSPVPYLFGGLAAMLGLIAFALLILACSYWKLSGYLDGDETGDVESGGAADGASKAESADVKPQACYEQRIVVIMAGDEKPTFLAMPISSRASSFGDHSSSGDGKSSDGDSDGNGEVEGKKIDSGVQGAESNSTDNYNLTAADGVREGENDQNSLHQGQQQ